MDFDLPLNKTNFMLENNWNFSLHYVQCMHLEKRYARLNGEKDILRKNFCKLRKLLRQIFYSWMNPTQLCKVSAKIL